MLLYSFCLSFLMFVTFYFFPPSQRKTEKAVWPRETSKGRCLSSGTPGEWFMCV